MTDQEQLFQSIFNELLLTKEYSVTKYHESHIIVGYRGRNFVFKVGNDKGPLPWNGEVEIISSFLEAKRIILIECLPF